MVGQDVRRIEVGNLIQRSGVFRMEVRGREEKLEVVEARVWRPRYPQRRWADGPAGASPGASPAGIGVIGRNVRIQI